MIQDIYEWLWNTWYAGFDSHGMRVVTNFNWLMAALWVFLGACAMGFAEPSEDGATEAIITLVTIIGAPAFALLFPVWVPVALFFLICWGGLELCHKWGQNYRRMSRPPNPNEIKKKLREMEKIIKETEDAND